MFTVATSSGHRGANGILRPLRSVHTTWSTPCERSKRLMSDFVPRGLDHGVPSKRVSGIAWIQTANSAIERPLSVSFL